jgi:hypothetical protein
MGLVVAIENGFEIEDAEEYAIVYTVQFFCNKKRKKLLFDLGGWEGRMPS